MHRLLKRLLKQTYGKEFEDIHFDEKTLELFKRIEESYIEADENKHFLEHTIKINSEELTQAYKTIEQHNQSLKNEVNEKEILLQQYKDAMDATLIVSKMDADGHITYVNNQFCELTQYECSELIGKEHILLHAKYMDADKHAAMWDKLIKSDTWRGRIESKNKSAEVYHVDVSVFPLVDAKGSVIEYMVLEHDITQLEHAREAAEASKRAKSQFMAHMSHEIRTPMNGIIGFTELLMKSNLDEKQREYIRLTENSMQTLLKITNDILDFSKIESGHLKLDFTDVNPFIDLKNALTIFSSKCREKHLSFQLNIDTSIAECIKLDKLRVTQVLNNLINNAIKFTPEQGTVSVEIKRLATDGNKQRLLLSVSDTGIGISKENIIDIFKSFIQADKSTTRKFGGTGLGLSISSSLCQLMNSELKVQSEENKGSTFSFELDVEVCETTSSLARQIKNPPIYVIKSTSHMYDTVIGQLRNFSVHYETISLEKYLTLNEKEKIVIIFQNEYYHSISLYTKTIILIEDTHESYMLAKEEETLCHISLFEECPSILYNAILEYSFIKSDLDANSKKSKKGFSLSVLVAEDYEINRILIDEMLKSYEVEADFAINGTEAVKKAFEHDYDLIFMDINMPELNGIEAAKMIHDKIPNIPIVALTANALEGDKEYYLSEGMDNYISKPVDMEVLYRVLTLYSKDSIRQESAEIPKEEILEVSSKYDDRIDAIIQAKNTMRFSNTVMKRLFESFIKGSYSASIDLLDAVKENDMERVKRNAHSIRGGALSLNFSDIAEICRLIEYGDAMHKETDYEALAQELKEALSMMYEAKEEILTKI